MVYVDTNVLVYISVNQGEEKQEQSVKRVRELIEKEKLFLSPLSIQEFIFTLSKLKIDSAQIDKDVAVYMDHVQQVIDKSVVNEAYSLCKTMEFCKNINDVIHLKMAERYCRKLISYDSDFKKFKDKTSIEIEILR